MKRHTAEELVKLLKGENSGSFTEELLCELFSEIQQVHQKQNEILRLLNETKKGES